VILGVEAEGKGKGEREEEESGAPGLWADGHA
jgi:prepilin-type processing-associated H-X9-DG protein